MFITIKQMSGGRYLCILSNDTMSVSGVGDTEITAMNNARENLRRYEGALA